MTNCTTCTTQACPGLTGEIYLTEKGWVTYCPVCREITTAVTRQGEPDEADKLAAEAYTYAATQEYARAEEKLMQAAGLAADKGRRRFYLWYALLCRYGVYYVREERYPNIPARRTNLFVPTFGRFPLPDYKIRKCDAYKQLSLMQMPEGAVQAVNELYSLLLEIGDCIEEEENRFKIFVAWHDRVDESDGPCRTFARKLNSRLNDRRMFSFASFSALNEITVAHYEPHIYAALATAQVMVIVIDDYDALGKKFLKSEIIRFLTRRKTNRSLQIYFVGLQGHTGEVPESLAGIGGWQKHIENACDNEWCYSSVLANLQRLLAEKKREKSLEAASRTADRPVGSAEPKPAAPENTFAALREKIAQYNLAVQLVEKGDYDGASAAFAAAGDYRDAAERIHEPYYVQAEKMLEAGDRDGAAAMFAALGDIGFRDASQRAGEVLISADEMYNRGEDFYFGRGVDTDYYRAAKWYRNAAKAGHVYGMCRIGWMYDKGYGVMQDYAEAVKWYHKAAIHDNAEAMFRLGYMYHYGCSVKQDHATAVEWYRKGAERGYVTAMMYLAYMYYHGHGVAQDYGEAVAWYRKAAEAGDAGGMFNLGLMYEAGCGVPKNYAEAMQWYYKAAAMGDASAMKNMGWLYEKGLGIPRNKQKAKEYYLLAQKHGRDVSEDLRRLGI